MERDLCANCDRWREQHYSGGAAGGPFIGDQFGCVEYQGSVPTKERAAKKDAELAAWEKKRKGGQ